MEEELEFRSMMVHRLFPTFEGKDTCTLPGTAYIDDILQPCGEEVVGTGLFCDPSHSYCSIESLCARHAGRPIQSFTPDEDGGWA